MFVIIVGGGKLGANLTRILLEEGNEIAVVDADWNRYRELKEWFPESAVFGNATELRVLREAGIERADSLVAVAGADQVNLVCSELAQKKYKLSNVVARVNNPQNLEVFRRSGIVHAVSVTNLMLATIHQELGVGDVVRLMDLRKGNQEIVELFVGPRSPLAGRRFADIRFPASATILAVVSEISCEAPSPDTVLKEGDAILAVVPLGSEVELEAVVEGRQNL